MPNMRNIPRFEYPLLAAAFGLAFVMVADCVSASAQSPSPSGNPISMEGVTLGEPMRQLREMLGDPIHVTTVRQGQIWRYLERGGAVYLDIMPTNNVVISITVVRRFDDSPYTDDRGVSFGSSSAAVQAKIGVPTKRSTNSDDGSVDLWYISGDTARIYEFYADKLGFVQEIARPGSSLTSGNHDEPVLPPDGTSLANAIRIKPSNLLADSAWIDAYFSMNPCEGGGRWKETSTNLQADSASNDPIAYIVVQAKCTSGSTSSTFYFDTHGAASPGQDGKGTTIYVDPSQFQTSPQATAAPSRPPSNAHARTPF